MGKNKIPMEEKTNPTQEETQELEATQAKEEEVREKIITDYGFNEDDDADKIDKLVEREMDIAKKLSSAIGQKIKHRQEAEELKKQLEKNTPGPKKDNVKIDNNDDLDKKLDERFEKRELESLDYSDELKAEIQKLAKLQNVSIKQALRDPYISYKVEEYKKEQKTDEASISRNNKKGGKKTYSLDNPPDVDFGTEEGRKEWEDYKQAMIKAGN